jgi:hypothetical protein
LSEAVVVVELLCDDKRCMLLQLLKINSSPIVCVNLKFIRRTQYKDPFIITAPGWISFTVFINKKQNVENDEVIFDSYLRNLLVLSVNC